MSLANYFNPAPAIRPFFNQGCVFDIPTGTYVSGVHGEMILNGGLPHITGISGRGETGKSLIADYFMLVTMDRYSADSVAYDTEETKTQVRMTSLSQRFENLKRIDIFEQNNGLQRMMISASDTMPGEIFFTAFKSYLNDKRKDMKKNTRTTPFVVKEEPEKILTPTVGMIDSFSGWLPTTVVNLHDKADVGDSALNMEAINAGRARSQLMSQLPALLASTGGYIILTAHLGDEMITDPHSASKKKLGFLKGDQKMKRVPENYTFLTNNLWKTEKMTVMFKSGSKELEYPLGLAAESEGQTELSVIHLQLLRTKSPAAGRFFEIIVSRTEGVLPHLTQFHYMKEHGRWGLGGNLQNYYLELLPDVALSRTTVRRKIDSDPKLRRAIEISSDLLQLRDFWNLDKNFVCTPKELYEDIKKAGYNWDTLLATRGYWMFEEDVTPETPPFLSSMDLLNMRAGTYKPYWLTS